MADHEHQSATAAAIRAAGLRVTDSRRAVLEALSRRSHASVEMIHADVLRGIPSTSPQSVYNALADFTDAGLVRRIEPAGHPMLFELRVGDNHHHLICTRCDRIQDVDCAVGEAPCLQPADAHGFSVAAADVTFWGVCADCAARP